MIKIAPSLLAADFAHLSDDIDIVNHSEAAMFHIDVMDGLFVPNISIGFPVIEAIARHARLPLDVHMMVTDPGRFVERLAKIGVHSVNVHQEACIHLHSVISQIKSFGMRAAVTLCPATPVETLVDIITDVDMVLLMGVNPGFGGQTFIPSTIDKTRRLRQLILATGSNADIQIDGGVNQHTAPLLVEAGANVLVAGSYVFHSPDPKQAIAHLAHLDEL